MQILLALLLNCCVSDTSSPITLNKEYVIHQLKSDQPFYTFIRLRTSDSGGISNYRMIPSWELHKYYTQNLGLKDSEYYTILSSAILNDSIFSGKFLSNFTVLIVRNDYMVLLNNISIRDVFKIYFKDRYLLKEYWYFDNEFMAYFFTHNIKFIWDGNMPLRVEANAWYRLTNSVNQNTQ